MTHINIKSDEPIFPISTAAKLLNISVHTLMMYEREGLFISYKKILTGVFFQNRMLERIKCIRRWINELKISINGIKAIYSLVLCWSIINCKEENRSKCRAFNGHSQPCWSYM